MQIHNDNIYYKWYDLRFPVEFSAQVHEVTSDRDSDCD